MSPSIPTHSVSLLRELASDERPHEMQASRTVPAPEAHTHASVSSLPSCPLRTPDHAQKLASTWESAAEFSHALSPARACQPSQPLATLRIGAEFPSDARLPPASRVPLSAMSLSL